MAAYNCFLKEVPTDTLTTHTGGTSQEILGRQSVDPASPSTSKLVSDATAGHKVEAKIEPAAGLAADLAGGGKIVALTVHVNAKTSTEGKRFKFGVVTPTVNAEPNVTVAQGWYTVSLSKAQAEALSSIASLESLLLLIETGAAAKTWSGYEIYVSLETEAGSSFSGSVIGTLGLRNVVAGAKAAGSAIAARLGLTSTVAGSKIGAGALTQMMGQRQTLVGSKTTFGALTQTIGLRDVVGGNKIASGVLSQRSAQRGQLQGVKAAQGSVAGRLGLSQLLSGRKASQGSATGQMALRGALLGRKAASGALTSTLALVQRWVIITEPTEPGKAIATVYVKNAAVATVHVLDDAEAQVNVIDRAEGKVSA
jgi:hypothetical protein